MSRFRWKIEEWGRTADEKIKGEPTEADLHQATRLTIFYQNVDNDEDVRWAIIRNPEGFGNFRDSVQDDLNAFVDQQADRYSMELVNSAP